MSNLNKSNPLHQEKSPYLQLHAEDPVEWQAWGEPALLKAKSENKLILLSIGYLACHWCHVMAAESYQDLEVAKLINTDFVPILIDREERPDLDQYFIHVCRLLLDGSGGWPLNVILTPEMVPVFTCIYLPKNSRGGGPGFYNVLEKYSTLWKSAPGEIKKNSLLILEKIKKDASGSNSHVLQREVLQNAVSNLHRDYDADYGGFGPEPKFIMPHRLLFLLDRFRKSGKTDIIEMIQKTCDAMRYGGVYDQLGSGVHRYSTDIFWFEPHFEKMAYDQAGLIQVYAQVWSLTGKALYAETTEELIDYLAREMMYSDGSFAAAEDADSDGKDGKFYLWTRQEILETLGDQQGERFCQVFGVTKNGNFRINTDGNGLNILARKKSFSAWAKDFETSEPIFRQEITLATNKLFEKRKQRSAPAIDSLVITSWNGMIISSLAISGEIFARKTWLAMAKRAASFFSSQTKANGILHHSYLGGSGNIKAFASDYIFLAKGFLDLYRATLESQWLEQCVNLFEVCLELFWDEQKGGLLETTTESFSAPFAVTSMDERDLPSVNAIALELCCWFAFIFENQKWQRYADRIVETLGRHLAGSPEDYPAFLSAYGRYVEPLRKVVIAGEENKSDTTTLLHVAKNNYDPNTLVLLDPPENSNGLFAHTNRHPLVNGKAAAYICDSAGCYAPITKAHKLQQKLAKTPMRHLY